VIRDDLEHRTPWRRDELVALRRRLDVVPIGDRLLEVIALSAALLADSLGRQVRAGVTPAERPLPIGLGSRRA
jgi:hypothetical protein